MTKLLLCDCMGTQSPDAKAIEAATGLACSRVHTALCAHQLETSAKAIADGDVIIACGQEQARFEALAEELGADAPLCVDLRDRAGWSDEGAKATPKMAALLADARLPVPPLKTLDVESHGTCLILGGDARALKVAHALADDLAVTLLLPPGADPERDAGFDVVLGSVRRASGALGRFDVVLDDFQQVLPGGRAAPVLTEARDGATSQCDIILDLRGAPALFPADHKRDGYLRADPGSQPAVAAATRAAAQLVGTFEKPLHVRVEPLLCAHSRAEQAACTRCLDLCPTGAITPAGEHVAVDPLICAGCGACSASCPSGAISLDAPPVETTFRRLAALADAYRSAGGASPRLLVHDPDHGAEMIQLAARHGRGLPADVIPCEVAALAGYGHAEMIAALACGFAGVDLLLSPGSERDVLETQTALARALSGGGAITLIDLSDPDDLAEALYAGEPAKPASPILPMGSRRQIARQAAKALMPEASIVDLPEGAPYGAVLVDTEACTLCLSCASLCPAGALGDNPDLPQLRFQEDACLQCGLCVSVCPEDAITLAPRMDLTDAALGQRVLHEEEPFACVECGKLFGSKSTIERITEKLAGKHAMFATGDAARMIQMCDTCRVNAQYHSENSPFAGGERPKIRTTEDYLSKRRDH